LSRDSNYRFVAELAVLLARHDIRKIKAVLKVWKSAEAAAEAVT
jgi:hypothetical protein